MNGRGAIFAVVGALGFGVQLATLAALVRLGCPLAATTAIAVEAAVLHNYCWHERWTWRDRRNGASTLARLLRFHGANGIVSIAANVILTSIVVRTLGWSPVMANTVAVAAGSAVNFLVADRWVFVRAAAVVMVGLVIARPARAAAQPAPETLAAWDHHVHDLEAGSLTPSRSTCVPGTEPQGSSVAVPNGSIHRWTGCLLVRNVTVDSLVHALVERGTPPPQEDVLESRVLARHGDTLRVYMKLIRRTIITVRYDTEHEMTFTRGSPTLTTARSVATRIVQDDGGDRGFLWRLNSYWTYLQQGRDVRIDVVSLSLSRDVPLLARPIVGPLVTRVGRESMTRTLDALQRFLATS